MPDQITIPGNLRDAVEEDDIAARSEWLARLPDTIIEIANDWGLKLGQPYLPGGQCAWVAPSVKERVLKVQWRHWEAEHEIDALRLWDGDGAIRCFSTRMLGDTTASLFERCVPGVSLKATLPEAEQDEVVAGLMRRLWEHQPPDNNPFDSLEYLCGRWAESFELRFEQADRLLDRGIAREAMALLRELPRTADRTVVVATDLHAGNILSAQRESWLVIDPKPFVGDPAFDPVQHMLNCDQRLASDPIGLARRMAGLLDLDAERVRLWLFARCAQESPGDLTMREPARILAGAHAPTRGRAHVRARTAN